MGTRWSRRFLRCFYCGQRSTVPFQAQKSFRCSNCDATNWLDQNGEITDPPAASGSPQRVNVRYATPRASVPPRSPSPTGLVGDNVSDEAIFCAVCLRNQQMLSSSLAQFEWPEDPTSAEYSARERKYWALRKTLEKRYPQVCDDCIPKVNRKLNQASYTAQTDHLRRMMDRTRSRRTEIKRRGPLDLIDLLGKMSWHAGFILQAVWHAVVISLIVAEIYALALEEDSVLLPWGILNHSRVIVRNSDKLMQWAINLGMCSFPWNPRFKQSIRGFTTHILGFRQWYTYQLLILLVRFVAFSIAQYSKIQGLPATSQLTSQLVVAFLTTSVYFTAKASIHTDTSPLFRRPTELTAGSRKEPRDDFAARDPDDLGSALDDILRSSSTQDDSDRTVPNSPETSFTAHPTPPTHAIGGNRHSALFNLSMSNEATRFDQREREGSYYDEEMDWAPSASQHRAFSSYNPYRVKNTNPRFNDAPTEAKPGPIWYKVPPAPTNPAQRAWNPPMRPIIRESPKERKESFFKPSGRQPIRFGGGARDDSPGLNLARPRFFAPAPEDDPRDDLSHMFAKSFTISPSPDEPEERSKWRPQKEQLQEMGTIPDRRTTRMAELVALLAALCGWFFAQRSQEHYGRSVALASICVYLMVSIRLAADLEVDQQIRGGRRPSVFTPSLANFALIQMTTIILLMWHVWSGSTLWASSEVYGNTLFGSIIVHHLWHTFA